MAIHRKGVAVNRHSPTFSGRPVPIGHPNLSPSGRFYPHTVTRFALTGEL